MGEVWKSLQRPRTERGEGMWQEEKGSVASVPETSLHAGQCDTPPSGCMGTADKATGLPQ